MPSLDSVTFDAFGLVPQGDYDRVRIWQTFGGDGIELYYFPNPPYIDADLRSLGAVRAIYRTLTTRPGAAIIEADVVTISSCVAVRVIFEVPQDSYGMTYLGSITLPCRDFSYVVKIQCMEQGVTVLGNSPVFWGRSGSEDLKLDETAAGLWGWMQDLHDPAIRDVFARNTSEAEDCDQRSPTHPLSRVRRLLRAVEETLPVSDDVRAAPRFEYPRR